MADGFFDFGDAALSEAERLAAFSALSRGFVPVIDMLFQRVKAYNDVLEEELEERPAAAECLRASAHAVQCALGWLQAYREATTCEEELENVDLRPLLEGAVVRSNKILPQEIRLSMEIGEGMSVVCGVLFQLQDVIMRGIQVFLERFALPDTPVSVRMHCLELSVETSRLLRSDCLPGEYVAITLSSGGNGTPRDEHQDGFWEYLLAAEDGRSDPVRDLAIVHLYGVVLAHGGDVFFTPAGGACGTTMSVLFPMAHRRKDMQVTANLEDESLYGTETILLVDDEDMIWDVIIDMLQELGYSVLLAGNGKEAVEIYRENPGEIDVVMLDMVMPEMDGHKAFFELKSIDPDVCVLLSSGYVSEEEARDVLDAGAVGFLQKPYRMIDLARTVRGIFDKNRDS